MAINVKIRTIKSPVIVLPSRKQKAFQQAVDKLFAERLAVINNNPPRKKRACPK
jgi:hypothetical protein